MKQIVCPIIGRPTDTPILTVDPRDLPTSPTYIGTISGSTVLFELADREPSPYGSTIRFGNDSVRYVLPSGDGVGPALTYPPAVSRLHVEDDHFVDEQGIRRVLALHTDFRLLQMFLRGEDVGAVLDARMGTVADDPILVRGPRVFGTCAFLFDLKPADYGDYYTSLNGFSHLMAERGLYWEYTALTDAQAMPVADQQQHWQRACEALAGEPNVILELGNENQKNAIDARHFSHPQNGCVVSSGSYCDGWVPTGAWGDYVTFHPRRDWKWPFTVAATVNELREYPGQHKAILINEPIGAAEQAQPGRRASDADLFERMAVDCAVWGAGGVFHSEAGLVSAPWGSVQQQCASAFVHGLTR